MASDGRHRARAELPGAAARRPSPVWARPAPPRTAAPAPARPRSRALARRRPRLRPGDLGLRAGAARARWPGLGLLAGLRRRGGCGRGCGRSRPASPLGARRRRGSLLVARAVGASAASPVTALRPAVALDGGLADLARADRRPVRACRSRWSWTGRSGRRCRCRSRALLGIGWSCCSPRAPGTRRALPLLGWAAALAAAFALQPAHGRRRGALPLRPRRCPLLALAGCRAGPRVAGGRAPRPSWPAAAVVPGAIGQHAALCAAWRDPAPRRARLAGAAPRPGARTRWTGRAYAARTRACSSRPG